MIGVIKVHCAGKCEALLGNYRTSIDRGLGQTGRTPDQHHDADRP